MEHYEREKTDGKRRSARARHDTIHILFEDEHICVIHKPTGMLSVPYPGSSGRTAQQVLEEVMRRNGTYSARHRPFAVHRLDRDTSGVMMFALTESAQKKIMDFWQTMVTERLYRAVAENPRDPKLFLPESGCIDSPIAFTEYNIGFVPVPGGRTEADSDRKYKTVSARTNYRIVAAGRTHTLFELSLDTGRKNQIRAHLASKGYPLAGDSHYRARTDYFHRLCLHARTLAFVHPFTNQALRFECAEPPEWKSYVERGEVRSDGSAQAAWRDNAKNVRGSQKMHNGREKKRSRDDKSGGRAEKRLSAKDKARLDFIALGKLKSR